MVVFSLVAISASIAMNIIQMTSQVVPGNKFETFRNYFKKEFLLLGIGKVNVFNRPDMEMGNSSVVIAELSEENKILRVVPYMDLNGGRLDYLRNDYVYFNLSLRWQRTTKRSRYLVDKSGHKVVSKKTREVIEKIIDYDLCQKDIRKKSKFLVVFSEREMVPSQVGMSWGEVKYYTHYIKDINKSYIDKIKSKPICRYSYRLNPGHFFTDFREGNTLKYIKELNLI